MDNGKSGQTSFLLRCGKVLEIEVLCGSRNFLMILCVLAESTVVDTLSAIVLSRGSSFEICESDGLGVISGPKQKPCLCAFVYEGYSSGNFPF